MNWKKINRVVLAVVVIILLNGIFSYLFRKEMEGRVINQLDKEFYQSKKPVKHLVLGNSHAFAIRPRPEDSAVLFCSYGENIIQTYYRLNKVLELKSRKIEKIILPFDFQALSGHGIPNLNIDFWVKYVDFLDYAKNTNEYSDNLFKYLKGNFVPYSGQSMAVWEAINLKEENFNGQANQVMLSDNSTNCPKEIIDSIAEFYFFRIFDLCKENDIDLILIKYPYRRDYFENLQKCFTEKEYFPILETKIKARNQGVIILDYSKNYIDQPEFFDDGHHLSSEGQIRHLFTKSVFDTLKMLN